MRNMAKEFKSLRELSRYQGPWKKAVVVYAKDNYGEQYSEAERSYVISHDSNYFKDGLMSKRLTGICEVDGDVARLDWYNWSIERIYLKEE
jgi:hypothetical protein